MADTTARGLDNSAIIQQQQEQIAFLEEQFEKSKKVEAEKEKELVKQLEKYLATQMEEMKAEIMNSQAEATPQNVPIPETPQQQTRSLFHQPVQKQVNINSQHLPLIPQLMVEKTQKLLTHRTYMEVPPRIILKEAEQGQDIHLDRHQTKLQQLVRRKQDLGTIGTSSYPRKGNLQES